MKRFLRFEIREQRLAEGCLDIAGDDHIHHLPHPITAPRTMTIVSSTDGRYPPEAQDRHALLLRSSRHRDGTSSSDPNPPVLNVPTRSSLLALTRFVSKIVDRPKNGAARPVTAARGALRL